MRHGMAHSGSPILRILSYSLWKIDLRLSDRTSHAAASFDSFVWYLNLSSHLFRSRCF